MTGALFNIQMHSLTKTLSIYVSCNLPIYTSKDNYLLYKMRNALFRNIHANVIQVMSTHYNRNIMLWLAWKETIA